MKILTLNDKNTIPLVGFGTYKATESQGIASVKTAIEKGYRLIDTAAKYENEEAVGKGIKASGIDRAELFITTKVWREDMGYEQTIRALDESLKKLQLDYIDLYLIHWPANELNYSNWQQTNADVWRAMEELQAQGKIKSLGVSNFWPQHLVELFQTAKVLPAVNQIEFHPGYWQPEVTKFCKEYGIVIEAWSPFARGKIFDNQVLKDIAVHHGKSISQIAIRWIIQHGAVAIPKSITAERIEENMNVFDFQLSEKEMLLIDQLPEMGFSGELPNIWPDRVSID